MKTFTLPVLDPFQVPNVLSSGQIGWQMLQCIALEKLVQQHSNENLIWILCKTAQERETLVNLVTKVVKEAQLSIDTRRSLNDPIAFGFLERSIFQEFQDTASEKWIDTKTALDFLNEIKEKFNFQNHQSAVLLLMAALLWTHPNTNIIMRLTNIMSITSKTNATPEQQRKEFFELDFILRTNIPEDFQSNFYSKYGFLVRILNCFIDHQFENPNAIKDTV